ncbi:MAG TPA: hypothetical protein PKE49_15135 [Leptospiraceae bacterium]|jgi:hypothetical protein|nr:hypothetical protein [Leptospirales bacterium]HMU82079.1 hypothetical protein [Leptospiraceae bacterium]HMX57859.1 hypothetical protein [Leptospiraceae bacterium]HNE21636.1 hypothetical protein [Leptospiraceae bacterium]HNJ33522.1 hypothetical protein [Leptospiraceae bacterium]
MKFGELKEDFRKRWPEWSARIIQTVRELPSTIRQAAKDSWPVIQSEARALPARLKAVPGHVVGFFAKLASVDGGPLRKLTFLWCFALGFSAVCILGRTNPFALLIPVWGVTRPASDSRSAVSLRMFPAEGDAIISVTRKLRLNDSLEHNLEALARTVSETAGIHDTSAPVANLPDYAFAIRKVWVTKEKSCILDFRSETLRVETEQYTRNRTKIGEKAVLLDRYFQSLTESIFASAIGCKSVRYLLDGKVDQVKEMKFDLKVERTPG